MKLSTIQFSELNEYNDSNSLVFTGLCLAEEDVPEVEKFFHSKGLMSADKHIIDVKHIEGNVLGEEGRTDWLFVFDNEDKQFNPMVRLSMSPMGVKWTSDFIDNYAADYAA